MSRKGHTATEAHAGGREAALPVRVEAVYQGLRRTIIEQAIAPGTRLPEVDLGRQYGVSRTIVRTALSWLAAEGLVEKLAHRSAIVACPSLGEARDIFEVRTTLECLAARTLAGGLARPDLTRLRAHVSEERRVRSGEAERSIRLAGEFHVLLADLSRNGVLARYLRELVSRCSLILALYGRPHSSECAVAEHSRIVDALANGEAAVAERMMRSHLEAVMQRALIAGGDARRTAS